MTQLRQENTKNQNSTIEIPRKSYTRELKCSLILALMASTMMSFNMCMFTSIHSFIKCFIYVNGDYGGEPQGQDNALTYQTYCTNQTNLNYLSELKKQENTNLTIKEQKIIQTINLSWGLIASTILICVPPTALFCIFLNNNFGRKRTLQLSILMNILGLIIMSLGFSYNFYNLFLFGRFLSGITIGINVTCTPLYLQEIALPSQRRQFGSYFFIFLNVGIILITVLELEEIFGKAENWFYVMYLGIFLQSLTLIVSFFAVDTPDFAKSLGKFEEADILMVKLHGFGDSERLRLVGMERKCDGAKCQADDEVSSKAESIKSLFKNIHSNIFEKRQN